MADPTTRNTVATEANEANGAVDIFKTNELAPAICPDPPEPNIKIGMSFSFGKLQGPFGEATVDGVVPLLLPERKFPTPSIVRDPALMSDLLTKLMPEYRELWPNLLDEEVEARLRDYIVMASFVFPSLDLHDPARHVSVRLFAFAFALDDFVDDSEFADNHTYKDAKNISQFFYDIFSGKYATFDVLINPTVALSHLNAHTWAFYQSCKDSTPGFHENGVHFVQRMAQVTEAHVLLMEDNAFSATSKAYFRAIDSGVAVLPEFVAMVLGLEIPKSVRGDLLFDRLMYYIAASANLMNDIFGLARDMRIEQVKDSSILSAVVQRGLGLQQAFDNTLKELDEYIKDIQIAVATLRVVYGSHEDLQTFLRLAEMVVDGQIRAYAVVERYKTTGMRIVEMADDQ